MDYTNCIFKNPGENELCINTICNLEGEKKVGLAIINILKPILSYGKGQIHINTIKKDGTPSTFFTIDIDTNPRGTVSNKYEIIFYKSSTNNIIDKAFFLTDSSILTCNEDRSFTLKNVLINELYTKTSLRGGKNSIKYIKTSKEYKDKAGKTYKVYSKGENMYIKKKSAKTGKFGYRKVNIKKI